MRATFSGIEIARRALHASQQGLDVTGHNIANVNTPGYSRQVARLVATNPFTVPSFHSPTTAGQMGTGVTVEEVMRMRDSFVQNQINAETQAKGYWETRESILRELELTFLEPTSSGIQNAMDQFWESLQELSKSPESQAVRSVVRERALVLAETIRNTFEQFAPLRKQLDTELRAKVEEINSLADQITAVTAEISAVLVAGDVPNDLFDKREVLIEKLARIADIGVVERSGGMLAIAIGGVTLVDGVHSRHIEAEDLDGDGFADLRWEGTGGPVNLRSGELKALLEGRDEVLPEYMEYVNELARTLIVEVNAIHNQGYGLRETFDPNDYVPYNPGGGPPPVPPSRDFFEDGMPGIGVDNAYLENAAQVITLSADILADAGNIAASRNGSVGDGANALRMAQLKQTRIFLNGTATPSEFLGSVVSGLGVLSQKATGMVEHQEVLLEHLERLRTSVSGVSLDEEMTNLIQFQHAYAAASRVVTTMDEAIDVIINRMGLVGR